MNRVFPVDLATAPIGQANEARTVLKVTLKWGMSRPTPDWIDALFGGYRPAVRPPLACRPGPRSVAAFHPLAYDHQWSRFNSPPKRT